MTQGIQDKVIVITGASSGLGEAAARRLARAGAKLVLGARRLERMQALARELNNGDTAFVLRPDADDHDVRIRFFTPRREAAFVGHATLAAHTVLASVGEPARRRQKQQSGIVEIDIIDIESGRLVAKLRAAPPGRQ